MTHPGNTVVHTAQPSRRGRRPMEVVRAEVLAAAGDLLLLEGVAGFTMEKVAARSGASRVTLNKHWPSRGALALEAYLIKTRDRLAFCDTGIIADDLIAVLCAWVGVLEEPAERRAFTQLIGTAQSDPDLASAFGTHYFGPRREEALTMLATSRDRGQLRADVDLPTLVDMLWGACYHRLLLPNLTGTLTADFIKTLVQTALRGTVPPPSADVS